MTLTPRFAEALQCTYELHGEQVRKDPDTTPYLAHLMSVSALVIEHGGGEDDAIAGLLHDAIEDAGGAKVEQEIADRFGARVAELVRNVSDTDEDPKPPWRARKEAYLAHLAEVDEATIRLSAADKLHNARQLLADYARDGERLWGRFNAGRDDQLWVYGAYGDAFEARLAALGETDGRTAQLVRGLRDVVDELRAAVGAEPGEADDLAADAVDEELVDAVAGDASPLDDEALTPRRALAEWARSLRLLYDHKVVRTFNNPIGDLAEELVYRHVGGERGSFVEKAWDVKAPDGERIQVKAMRNTGAGKQRRNLSPIRSSAEEWDTLVVVMFDEHLRVERAFSLPARQTLEKARYSKHVRGSIVTLTNEFLESPDLTDLELDTSWLAEPLGAPSAP
jgi:HD domain